MDLKQMVALGEHILASDPESTRVSEIARIAMAADNTNYIHGSRVHTEIRDIHDAFILGMIDTTRPSVFTSSMKPKEKRRRWAKAMKRLRAAVAADKKTLSLPESVDMVVSTELSKARQIVDGWDLK